MMLLSNIPAPNVGIQHKEDQTGAFIDGRNAGNGTLYITESHVAWITGAGQGFMLEYPNICLHAISRDLTSFPQECLYLQLEGKLFDEPEGEDNSSSEDEDDTPVTEVRFVPADKAALEAMFSSMSDCQALHPDPEDEDSEVEEGQFYEGPEGEAELTSHGQATLQHLNNLLQSGPGEALNNILHGQGDADSASQQPANGNIEAMEDDDGQFDDADMEQ